MAGRNDGTRQVKEVLALAREPRDWLVVEPDESNARLWTAHVTLLPTFIPPGATEAVPSPYAGRRFAVSVVFPATYPGQHPVFSFRAGSMWHPLVEKLDVGEVCLVPVMEGWWKPAIKCVDALDRLRSVLANPSGGNTTGDCEAQLRTDMAAFLAKARACAANEPAADASAAASSAGGGGSGGSS